MLRNNPTHVRFLSLEHGTIFVGVGSPHGLNEVRKHSFPSIITIFEMGFSKQNSF
jgi:hypothetical protein